MSSFEDLLFVSKTDEIPVKIFAAKSKSSDSIYADITKEDLIKTADGDIEEESIKEINCVFRFPDYSDNNEILDKCFKFEDNNMSLNPFKLRFERMCKLLKSWDLKNKEGKTVPINRSNIENLNNSIATIISLALESEFKKLNLI